jgi:hypothetical protein
MAAESTRLTSQQYYSIKWRHKCLLLFVLGPAGEFRKNGYEFIHCENVAKVLKHNSY